MKARRRGLWIALVALMLVLSACSGNAPISATQAATPTPQATANAKTGVAIIGAGINLTLGAEDIKALPQVDLNTKNIDSAGNVTQVKAKGISLTAYLKGKGVDTKTMDSVTFSASDGYSMAVPKDILQKRDLYILLELDGKALDNPRSAIPEERAMYWVRDLNKVELSTSAAAASKAKKIVLFKTGAANLPAQTITNKTDQVASTSLDVFCKTYLKATPTAAVLMQAKDGFKKNEKAETFLSCYVTYTGSEAPLYFSETLADGMRVKNLALVMAGDEAIYFGQKTISMKDLLKNCSMADGKDFEIAGIDGFKLAVTYDQLVKGTLKFENGSFTASIPGVTKANGTVKNALSIAIVD